MAPGSAKYNAKRRGISADLDMAGDSYLRGCDLFALHDRAALALGP
jgi:hypothetical protein